MHADHLLCRSAVVSYIFAFSGTRIFLRPIFFAYFTLPLLIINLSVYVASMIAASESWPAAVLVALRSPHMESESSVLESGLWAIASLSFGHAANQAQLGRFGACKGAEPLATQICLHGRSNLAQCHRHRYLNRFLVVCYFSSFY